MTGLNLAPFRSVLLFPAISLRIIKTMQTMNYLSITATAVLLFSARLAAAAVVYTAGPYSASNGAWRSDFDPTPASVPNSTNQLADKFTLTTSYRITGVYWWGLYAEGNTPLSDNFTIRVFESVNGRPAVNPLYQFLLGNPGRSPTGITSSGYNVYAYTATFPSPASLWGGTDYWFCIANNTIDDQNDSWYWMLAGGPDYVRPYENYLRESDALQWIRPNFQFPLAYDLLGEPVPEPGGAALAGGVMALSLLRRRRCTREWPEWR